MFSSNIISLLLPVCKKKSAFSENPLDWSILIKGTEIFRSTEIHDKLVSDLETKTVVAFGVKSIKFFFCKWNLICIK